MNASGQAILAWLDNGTNPNGFHVMARRFNGAWEAQTQDVHGSATLKNAMPWVAVSPTGTAHICMQETSLQSYIYQADPTGPWQTLSPTFIASQTEVVFDPAGNGINLFVDKVQQSYISHYVASPPAWQVPVTTTKSYGPLAVGANGIDMLMEFGSPNILAYLYSPATGLFSSAGAIPGAITGAIANTLLLADGNDFVALWTEANPAPPTMLAARYSGGAFGARSSLPGSHGLRVIQTSAELRAGIDARGNITAIWGEMPSGVPPENIMSQRYDAASGTWSSPSFVVQAPLAHDQLDLVVSAGGAVVLTWSDGNGIYAAALPP
jgi:hypothetical protein